jgi:hypothetical protein
MSSVETTRRNHAPLVLLYGRRSKPLAYAEPDADYPSMYRLRLADGRLSDMANKARILAAAVSAFPDMDHWLLHWEPAPLLSGPSQPSAGLNGSPLSDSTPEQDAPISLCGNSP